MTHHTKIVDTDLDWAVVGSVREYQARVEAALAGDALRLQPRAPEPESEPAKPVMATWKRDAASLFRSSHESVRSVFAPHLGVARA